MPPTQSPDPELAARKKMSFAQAEGAEELPSQLKRGEITPQMRSYLWAMIWESLKQCRRSTDWSGYYMDDPWRSILAAKHTVRDHKMADEFSNDADKLVADLKKTFSNGSCVEVLDLTEWILRRNACPSGLGSAIKTALEMSHSAYTVVDNDTVMPVSSPEESVAVIDAIKAASAAGLSGPRQHLKLAAQRLSSGKWADSIRESISAVESAAKIIEPSGGGLKPALAALAKKNKIHGALREGFASLYGFTSDEDGIRHALLEKAEAEVDATDAQYMLGACASFVSYLIAKAR